MIIITQILFQTIKGDELIDLFSTIDIKTVSHTSIKVAIDVNIFGYKIKSNPFEAIHINVAFKNKHLMVLDLWSSNCPNNI